MQQSCPVPLPGLVLITSQPAASSCCVCKNNGCVLVIFPPLFDPSSFLSHISTPRGKHLPAWGGNYRQCVGRRALGGPSVWKLLLLWVVRSFGRGINLLLCACNHVQLQQLLISVPLWKGRGAMVRSEEPELQKQVSLDVSVCARLGGWWQQFQPQQKLPSGDVRYPAQAAAAKQPADSRCILSCSA